MKIIKGIDCITNQGVQIGIENGIIASVEFFNENGNELPYIGPGLCDLQVNGYAGRDFNTLPLNKKDIEIAAKQMVKDGVTTFFPTLITNSDTNILTLLKGINNAIDESALLKKSIGGIHLEGPFISTMDGARGAHDKTFIKAPNWDLFQQFQEAANGKIKIITLSPEWNTSERFIKNCVNTKVIVAIGHSNATPEQIKRAVDAGASMSTHLGNGIATILPRHPNIIWEQLANENLQAGLIADGFHLPESFLKVALRAKQEQLFLVSDATLFTGMKAGSYTTHIGGNVTLNKDGRLYLTDKPEYLAGAAKPLIKGIEHLVFNNICSLSTAWEFASTKPLNIVGNTYAGIVKNDVANLVVFNIKDKRICFEEVIS